MTARLPAGLALVALWVLLWGDLSVGNVLSGTLLAGVLLVVFPFGVAREHGPARPLAMLKLVAYFVEQLVVSNLLLTRAILTRDKGLRTAVVTCRVTCPDDRVLTVLANVLALTPGMMPVEVYTDPYAISVHVLRFVDEDHTYERVARLERLVVAALDCAVPESEAP